MFVLDLVKRAGIRTSPSPSKPPPTNHEKFPTNLLIVLALALCGLCAFNGMSKPSSARKSSTQNGMLYDRERRHPEGHQFHRQR